MDFIEELIIETDKSNIPEASKQAIIDILLRKLFEEIQAERGEKF